MMHFVISFIRLRNAILPPNIPFYSLPFPSLPYNSPSCMMFPRQQQQPPKQQRQQPLMAGRKGSSSSSMEKKWLRNPLIWTLVVVVMTVLWSVSNDVSQTTYASLDTSFLKGTISMQVLPSILEEVPTTTATTTTIASREDTTTSSTTFDPEQSYLEQIQEWRSRMETSCRDMMASSNHRDTRSARKQKEQVEREALSKLHFPSTEDAGASVSGSLSADRQPYQYCRNVFIDLGTNIGDSIGYFVDIALDACSPIWLETLPGTKLNADFPRPHLDVTTLEVVHKGAGNNPLYAMLQQQMTNTTPALLPNSFCVYGMEGNPEFTHRLQKLENHVMQTQPRPVQHLHIHTESVVTAVDGPTKLFLDKTSVEQNFWGSSILSSQQDAVKSAQELGNGEVFSADVQGISLSTLTKNTVLAYKPDANPEETKGGLLIIKMDVEGAEYQVLKEAAASGVLCDYIQKGNRVVMIVEFHNMSITDPTERVRERTGFYEAKQALEECGVQFGNLRASWA